MQYKQNFVQEKVLALYLDELLVLYALKLREAYVLLFYDALYRLTSASHPQEYNPTEYYSYDSVGNMTCGGACSYNAANELTADPFFDYVYDADGNMIQKTERLFTGNQRQYNYDAEGQLTAIQIVDGPLITFGYDGLGRRIWIDVAGNVTKYVYDDEDILMEFRRSPFSTQDSYVARYTHGPGIDEPLMMYRLGKKYFYVYDGLGSVTDLVDENGNVVNHYEYDSFGNMVVRTENVKNPYTYTGREYDEDTQLYYYRARYYDAQSGRFLQRDTAGVMSRSNLYAYVKNNPIDWIDPSGLTSQSLAQYIWSFLSGSGSDFRHYFPMELETLEMQNSPGVKKLRDKFKKGGCKSVKGSIYNTGEAAWDTILNPNTADWTSTSVPVGGFEGAAINNKNGTVTYRIVNISGRHSFFYHLPFVSDKKSHKGPMRNIYQFFQWTEQTPKGCTCN